MTTLYTRCWGHPLETRKRLKFNDLSTESDQSEQRGMMYLYAGVMLAFRNPRAHGLIDDDAEEALDIISLVSFLAKALDSAKK